MVGPEGVMLSATRKAPGRGQRTNDHAKLVQKRQRRNHKRVVAQIAHRLDRLFHVSGVAGLRIKPEHVVAGEHSGQAFGNFVAGRIRIGAHQHAFVGGRDDFVDGGDQRSRLARARWPEYDVRQWHIVGVDDILDGNRLLVIELIGE